MFKVPGQSGSKTLPKLHPKGPIPADYPLPEPEYFEQKIKVPAFAFDVPDEMIDWYPGPIMGAQTIGEQIVESGKYVRDASKLFERLTPDSYSDYLQLYYKNGLDRYGDGWGYADLVTTVMGLADIIQPRNYLEIGVRRGRSVCAVASRVADCDIAMFDMWVENYAGMDNPGADFVLQELKKIGHSGKTEFFNGNSHNTLPAYFKDHPQSGFDMITVDGDHTNLGAAQDIADVIPHVAIGGAIIFDDVCHPKLLGLGEVWRRMVVDNRRFSSWTYSNVGYGVGFAIRKF